MIQRAIVVEHNAIIYQEADFDADQIAFLSRNKIIAVSTKIYRPKNLFGSFYKIYINKPKKIRGYISEIDVVPQYKQTQDGLVLNSIYKDKEVVLKQVQKRSRIQKYKKRRRAVTEETPVLKKKQTQKSVVQKTVSRKENTALSQSQEENSQIQKKNMQEGSSVLDVEKDTIQNEDKKSVQKENHS